MTKCSKIQFSLACFVLAALTGLIGFVIIYHFASYERPLQHFAIVIDAGSTQTRSNLFSIGVDISNLADRLEGNFSGEPLSKLMQVKHVSTCVNGGPLAELQSELGADEIVRKCLHKFARRIQRLDFTEATQIGATVLDEDESNFEVALDSDEVAQELAILDHRVNSITRIHLGATAGMRALRELNETRALEKIGWVERAIGDSNNWLKKGPFINKGFVDIIDGSEEATFGWVSVNFVCDKLQLGEERRQSFHRLSSEMNTQLNNSVGTLELGGASSQMAYQVPDWFSREQIQESGLEEETLDLFNSRYKLAARSDLCLGSSQAVLRANSVLMQDLHSKKIDYSNPIVEIENPCMQNEARISLSGTSFNESLKSPCLVSSLETPISFGKFLTRKSIIRFVGSGDVDKCNVLLRNLIEPTLCKKYFSLCPRNKNLKHPPSDLPFVTISGYNKAMQILGLKRANPTSIYSSKIEQMIADRLGGHSIDHVEFLKATKEFCSIDVSELSIKYPKMNKLYYGINCLQLVYINKLLTEFYLFDPLTNWNQIKFLIFPVAPRAPLDKKRESKNDIGWTLGLLVNATSYELDANSNSKRPEEVQFHHGSSTLFIVRTTLFLMFACCIVAIGLIIVAAILVRREQQAGAYISRSASSSGLSSVL